MLQKSLCVLCKTRVVARSKNLKDGTHTWKRRCANCRFIPLRVTPPSIRKKVDPRYIGLRNHRKFLKEFCEECKFIPVHRCQLDIDHKDGNKFNNSLDNLQTLCANCHRLKTLVNKEYNNKRSLLKNL